MDDTRSRPAIGVIFHPKFAPDTLADYARRAEAAGFEELWLWDDCFLPGALTSAAIALSATRQIKVGIGLMPATVYNPLFAAMEITTLALAFPDRILPGFGHGVGSWMTQIGAAPKSSLKALEETVTAVRRLLGGENVTTQGSQVRLDQVQMQLTPAHVPPLYIGAMREKSLQLAGRVGDGSILTGMSSPAYVRWALGHIRAGMAEAGRSQHRTIVYLDVKVNRDGQAARSAARQALARRLPWSDVHLNPSGIAAEVASFLEKHTRDEAAQQMPDEWVDTFSAAGTPDQAANAVQRWVDAGADSIVFQPLNGDPDCLDEYIRFLMPFNGR
jgi:alkanesulfonate monooxygenase SsuD/methylene tetrahydromethanopterin reductase-like flavin-dependent oxidoreductase (luciferase family)